MLIEICNKWRKYASPKRRITAIRWHRVTTQINVWHLASAQQERIADIGKQDPATRWTWASHWDVTSCCPVEAHLFLWNVRPFSASRRKPSKWPARSTRQEESLNIWLENVGHRETDVSHDYNFPLLFQILDTILHNLWDEYLETGFYSSEENGTSCKSLFLVAELT
jgi:hypothetical protein